ncbi:polysaccharide biosynthesis protein [Streptomyces indicus]|uniref:Chain length determinant protein n=1 Tax=Streptomyces indicus TaxID=417292 RepID=A0A1G8TP32_9ACTN|nr:polysaccharide biosynthesis protein [Streptomyces indicus]SDJ43163.1 Chain length determinant protein [Streptomyces indicus]
MHDEAIHLATVGRVVRRRLRLLAVLTLVGALVGLGLSVVFPPRYTTSASVLLSGQWEERELLTQAEIATSSAVLDRSAAALRRSGGNGGDLKDRVAAKVSEGNIIKVSGTAETPERAQRLADQVAKDYVAYAARLAGDTTDPDAALQPEALKKLVVQTSRRITELAKAADPGQSVESVQGRTELEKLRTALQESIEKLDEVDPALNRANMVVMGPAARPAGEAPPTRVQFIAGGALLFLLVAVVGHLAAARVGRRPRTEAEIAAALGCPVLGTVDVPGERSAEETEHGGARARTRRILGLDTRWDLPTLQASGGEEARRIRYGRVCGRLRDRLPSSGRPLLALVPDGDGVASRAALRLAAEAGDDPLLHVTGVSMVRPLVPDRGTEAGAVLVLGAGTWTAGDLAAVAESCADAGHELVGAVVAAAVRSRTAGADGRAPQGAAPVAVGADTRGGAS